MEESWLVYWILLLPDALILILVEVVPVDELHPSHHQKLGKRLQEIHETNKDETMLLGVSSLSSEHAAFLILYSVGGPFSSFCDHT